jgi:hypothetical protein
MSSPKKQIVIDPGNFSGGTNNTTLKRQKKVKPPAALIRPSTLKQNLLKKIKEHQQRHEETPQQPQQQQQQGGASDTDLANQFKMSTNYLEQLMARKQNKLATPKKPKTRTLPQPQMMQPMQPQTQMIQPIQPQTQMMQPIQPQTQMMQPQTQMMQPQMMQEVSLELPPELQLNPVSMSMPSPMPMPLQMPSPMPLPMPIQEPATNQVSSDEPPVNKLAFKDVPYGCLRGGNKPTYRTYHRNQPLTQNQNNVHNTTLKKSLFSETQSPLQQAELDPMIQERQRKLREIQMNSHTATNQNAATNESMTNESMTTATADETNDATTNDTINTMVPTKIKKEIKQTITKKYRLGKHASGKIVGVFIKNSDTRRKIQEEHGVLRRESIVEIRKYLHDHGLIKVGSDAPPDVLRNIYESAKMTGDVNNTNKHVMLHNFLKSDENTVDT